MIEQASKIEIWVGTKVKSFNIRTYGLIVQYRGIVSQHHAVHQESEPLAMLIHAINRVLYNIDGDDTVDEIKVYSRNAKAYHHRMAAIESYRYEVAQGVKRDKLSNIDLFLEYRALADRFNVKIATVFMKRDKDRISEAEQMAREIVDNDGQIGEQDDVPMLSHMT